MKHLKHTSDVSSPWRNANTVLEKVLPRNFDTVFEDQSCRSYTLHVVKEGLTEVELKLNGPMGIESIFTAPRNIFCMHIL